MNKKYITIVLSLIFITFLGIWIPYTRSIEEKSKVNWFYGYDEGLNTARDENKMVLINFYADWCGWCKKLDQETYSNRSIASYLNEKLVCIKIDVEKNQSVLENYNVYDLPTIVFLSSNGEEVGRIGYRPPDQFLVYVRDIIDQYG